MGSNFKSVASYCLSSEPSTRPLCIAIDCSCAFPPQELDHPEIQESCTYLGVTRALMWSWPVQPARLPRPPLVPLSWPFWCCSSRYPSSRSSTSSYKYSTFLPPPGGAFFPDANPWTLINNNQKSCPSKSRSVVHMSCPVHPSLVPPSSRLGAVLLSP